jgi:hypothetical protein
MRKEKMSRNNIVFFIIILLSTFLYSGNGLDNLYAFYQKKEFEKIKIELGKIDQENVNRYNFLFYETLFLNEGDVVVDRYQAVFKKGDALYKKLAAQKLFEYYYAKGYYMNAAKYQKFQAENPIPFPISPKNNATVSEEQSPAKTQKYSYQIQVGAFSVKDNAEQLKSMLKTQDVVSEIVERNINGSTLFCVWIKASDNFDETLRYATKIQRKYNLQYRIIKE